MSKLTELMNIEEGIKPQPPICILYSVAGWGKTFMSSKFPKPILLPFENGSSELNVTRLLPPGEKKINSIEYLMEALNNVLNSEHDYKTLVLDTASSLQDVIMRKVCNDEGVDSVEEIGYGRGYILAAQRYWPKIMDLLERIRTERKMIILILAHEQVTKFKNPAGNDYDRYSIQLRKEIVPDLVRWSDCVLFGNYYITTMEADASFGRATHKAAGSGARIIYTQERPSHIAKNRYNFPPEIEFEGNLDYAPIGKLISDFYNKQKTENEKGA